MRYSQRYSEEDPFIDAFHVYWVSPLGHMLEMLASRSGSPVPAGVPWRWLRPLLAADGSFVRMYLRTFVSAFRPGDGVPFERSAFMGMPVTSTCRVSCSIACSPAKRHIGFTVGRRTPHYPDDFAEDPLRPWLITLVHVIAEFVRLFGPTTTVTMDLMGVPRPVPAVFEADFAHRFELVAAKRSRGVFSMTMRM
jgi:hypothetical protein